MVVIEKPPCQTCHKPSCSTCEPSCGGDSCHNKPCRSCEKPCKCDRPPCKHCEKPCCEKPCCEKPQCNNGCHVESVAVITTVEVIESCPAYEEIIYNDEPQFIETNYTITSTYNISATELAQQQIEAQQFLHDQQAARKGICGGGFLHGIKHDEPEPVPSNTSDTLHDAIEFSNATKGHIIAEIANNHNNRPIKPCQITSGWSCRRIGRYPHPSNCQKVNTHHFFLFTFFVVIYGFSVH